MAKGGKADPAKEGEGRKKPARRKGKAVHEERKEEPHEERKPEEAHGETQREEHHHKEHAREEAQPVAQEEGARTDEKPEGEERHLPQKVGVEAEAAHEEERSAPAKPETGGAYEYEEEREIPWRRIAAAAVILIIAAVCILLLLQPARGAPAYPTPLIAASNTVIDAGQSVVFSAMANGNYTPLSYDFVITNAAGGVLANVINPNSLPYNSLIYPTNAVDAGNVLLVRVTVAYAQGKAVSNESQAVTVNPAMLAANVVTTATSVVRGQVANLTASWSGGTQPYTLRWYSGQSPLCAQDTSLLATGANLSETSGSITLSPSGSTWYCYAVTDSSGIPAMIASVAVEITVRSGGAGVATPAGSNSSTGQQTIVSAISSTLCGLVGSVMGIVGALSLALFLLGGVLYAISHFLPQSLEFKKSLTTWSTAMIVGAIIALIVVIAARPLLTLIANMGASATGASAIVISC
jgi:hypothetical protein